MKRSATTHVLVVTADSDAAGSVCSTLETAGYHVSTAHRGREAVDLVSGGTEEFDLVLMSVELAGGPHTGHLSLQVRAPRCRRASAN